MNDQLFDIEPEEREESDETPAPDPNAELEALKQQLEAERQRAQQLEQVGLQYQQAYNQALHARREELPKEEPIVVPDRDEDPDGYVEAMVAKRTKELLDAQLGPLKQQYTNDRATLLNGAIAANKAQAAAKFAGSGWSALEDKIEQYLSQFSADVRAQPGTYEEAFFRIKGMQSTAEEAERRAKEQAGVSDTGGRSGTAPPAAPREKSFTPEQLNVASREKFSSADELKAFAGAGRMSIDEYMALKEKQNAKRGA